VQRSWKRAAAATASRAGARAAPDMLFLNAWGGTRAVSREVLQRRTLHGIGHSSTWSMESRAQASVSWGGYALHQKPWILLGLYQLPPANHGWSSSGASGTGLCA
jgi:hypothetical protein